MSQHLVVAGHGSRDPRSAQAMRALAAGVARRWAGPVSVGFLDFDQPPLVQALRAAGDGVVVVPALLTYAYHGQVDVPAAVAESGVVARVALVLGADPSLVATLAARVRRLGPTAGVALVAAGTRDGAARLAIDGVAAALAAALAVPCAVGYASGGPPSAGDAVTSLRRRLGPAARIVAASYFLAPGRLHDAAWSAASGAGARAITAPLASPVAADLVRLVLGRATLAPALAASL